MDMKTRKEQSDGSGKIAVPRSGLFSGWLKALRLVTNGNRRHFAVIILTGLATNAFVGLVNPLAIKLIFDEGVIKKRFLVFIMFSLAFLLLFTCWRGVLYWYRIYLQDFKNKALRSSTLDMLRRFYRLPYPKVIEQEIGYFVSRTYDETAAAVLPIVDCTTALINSAVSFIASFTLALLLSWRATFVLLIVVPVIYALSSRFGAKLKRSTKHEKEQEAKFRGVLARAISAYKITRIFDLHEKVGEEAASSFDNFLRAFNSRFRDSAVYATLSGLCTSWTESAVTIVAGYEILSGRITFGSFMAFLNAFWMATGAIRQFLEQAGELPRITASVERMQEFEAYEDQAPAISGGAVLELKEAAFRYSHESDVVFGNLNLRVDMAEKVLVLGPNGTGKSTLAHILAGFLNISAGEARTPSMDRISVMAFPMNFVPGNVRANFTFGNGVVRREIFGELVEQFGIGDLLDRDPAGLSAGQQQRVYLAMALLKDADFYIFDEPLAHIDTHTRPLILDNILRFTENKGLISIMHGDVPLHKRFDRVVSLTRNAFYQEATAVTG